jgi:PAS domain-containing protein
MDRRSGKAQQTDSQRDLCAAGGLFKHIQRLRQFIDDAGGAAHSADPRIEAALADLEREAERLADGFERYRALAEAGHDIVYSVDADGVLTYVSPQIRLFGLEPKEMLGKRPFQYMDRRDRKRAKEALQAAAD